jgi:hypothetical protein
MPKKGKGNSRARMPPRPVRITSVVPSQLPLRDCQFLPIPCHRMMQSTVTPRLRTVRLALSFGFFGPLLTPFHDLSAEFRFEASHLLYLLARVVPNQSQSLRPILATRCLCLNQLCKSPRKECANPLVRSTVLIVPDRQIRAVRAPLEEALTPP